MQKGIAYKGELLVAFILPGEINCLVTHTQPALLQRTFYSLFYSYRLEEEQAHIGQQQSFSERAVNNIHAMVYWRITMPLIFTKESQCKAKLFLDMYQMNTANLNLSDV